MVAGLLLLVDLCSELQIPRKKTRRASIESTPNRVYSDAVETANKQTTQGMMGRYCGGPCGVSRESAVWEMHLPRPTRTHLNLDFGADQPAPLTHPEDQDARFNNGSK